MVTPPPIRFKSKVICRNKDPPNPKVGTLRVQKKLLMKYLTVEFFSTPPQRGFEPRPLD